MIEHIASLWARASHVVKLTNSRTLVVEVDVTVHEPVARLCHRFPRGLLYPSRARMLVYPANGTGYGPSRPIVYFCNAAYEGLCFAYNTSSEAESPDTGAQRTGQIAGAKSCISTAVTCQMLLHATPYLQQ